MSDDELQKHLAINSKHKESDDFDLAIDVYLEVVIDGKHAARMSLYYVPDSNARCMRIHFHQPDAEEEPETNDCWTAELRAITRIMEVARPILEALETKLRHAGREAWDNNGQVSSELFGYQ